MFLSPITLGLSTPLTFQAQNYTGDVRMLTINRPSDPLLTTFQIGLQNLSESVLSGGFIGGSEVFPISTIILEADGENISNIGEWDP